MVITCFGTPSGSNMVRFREGILFVAIQSAVSRHILGPRTPDQLTRLGLFGSKYAGNTNSKKFGKTILLY